MMEIDYEDLRALGLRPALIQAALALPAAGDTGARLARITEVQRNLIQVEDAHHANRLRIRPDLHSSLQLDGDALAVGDWVIVGPADRHAEEVIVARVPPVNQLARRDAFNGQRQVLVSNVDVALLVMGLDGDFQPRRLERYLALVRAAGLEAVVVLSKVDLAVHAESRIAAVRAVVPAEVSVVAVDGRQAAAADLLQPWLQAGQTLVMLGSSGAGKSTLSNTLAPGAHALTGAVREDDSRGRHTTTVRSLYRCNGGACLIDTPGLRTLRLDGDESMLAASFADIEAQALLCRFRDCTHQQEPGCAVRDTIAPERLRNWQKLLRELRRDTRTVLERREELASYKRRSRAVRAVMRQKHGEQ